MYSSLRIFQITLIITQILTVKGSSNVSAIMTSATDRLQITATGPVSAPASIITAQLSMSPYGSVTVWSPNTSNTSIVSSALVTTLTELSTTTGNVLGASTAMPSVVATSSIAAAQTSGTSNESSPSSPRKGSVITTDSPISVQVTTSKWVATTSNYVPTNYVPTKSTNFNGSSLLTGHTPSMTANYSSSLTSQRGSTATRSSSILQTLTTSHAVSPNWEDWSVDEEDCQKYCSEKGGTVTASRQCYYTKSIMLKSTVCTKHGNLTKVVKCGECHCPISGREAFRSSISTLTVSILLVMMSSTFVRG